MNYVLYIHTFQYRPIWKGSTGRILGRNWDKSLKSFPPCYSLSPLLTYFTLPHPPPPPRNKSGLKLVCNVTIVYGNLKNQTQQNFTFMNSASGGWGGLYLYCDSGGLTCQIRSWPNGRLVRPQHFIPVLEWRSVHGLVKHTGSTDSQGLLLDLKAHNITFM